jgi:hypothetical protein
MLSVGKIAKLSGVACGDNKNVAMLKTASMLLSGHPEQRRRICAQADDEMTFGSMISIDTG